MPRIPRRIAIPIRVIRPRAFRRKFLPPWRLHVLPHRRIRHASARNWRRLRRHASRRWRAYIVVNPIHQLPPMHVVPDIVRGSNVLVRLIRNRRTINSRPIPRPRSTHPPTLANKYETSATASRHPQYPKKSPCSPQILPPSPLPPRPSHRSTPSASPPHPSSPHSAAARDTAPQIQTPATSSAPASPSTY